MQPRVCSLGVWGLRSDSWPIMPTGFHTPCSSIAGCAEIRVGSPLRLFIRVFDEFARQIAVRFVAVDPFSGVVDADAEGEGEGMHGLCRLSIGSADVPAANIAAGWPVRAARVLRHVRFPNLQARQGRPPLIRKGIPFQCGGWTELGQRGWCHGCGQRRGRHPILASRTLRLPRLWL